MWTNSGQFFFTTSLQWWLRTNQFYICCCVWDHCPDAWPSLDLASASHWLYDCTVSRSCGCKQPKSSQLHHRADSYYEVLPCLVFSNEALKRLRFGVISPKDIVQKPLLFVQMLLCKPKLCRLLFIEKEKRLFSWQPFQTSHSCSVWSLQSLRWICWDDCGC